MHPFRLLQAYFFCFLSTVSSITVVELKCAVQCYAWGKIGLNSTVAQLAQHSPSFKLEEDKPYSEVFYLSISLQKQCNNTRCSWNDTVNKCNINVLDFLFWNFILDVSSGSLTIFPRHYNKS